MRKVLKQKAISLAQLFINVNDEKESFKLIAFIATLLLK